MLCHELMKKSFFNKNNPWKLCFYNEEIKSKGIQGKNVLSFTKFVLGGFCRGGLCPGGFCPDTTCVCKPFRPCNSATVNLNSIMQ